MTDTAERLMYEHLGEQALAYLLAIEAPSIHERFADEEPKPLEDRREEVIDQLVGMDRILQSRASGMPDGGVQREWTAALSGDGDHSLGNELRVVCGGSIPEVAADLSELEQLLAGLAIHVYPGFLVKEPENRVLSFSLGPKFPFDQWNQNFEGRVLADKTLKKLFYKKDPGRGWVGETRQAGTGGVQQLWVFAQNLLISGWDHSQLMSPHPTCEEYVEAVLEALRTVKAAVEAKEAATPVRVGLAGVLLPNSTERLDLGWAVIRRANDRDDRAIRHTGLEGHLHFVDSEGKTVSAKNSGDLVVEFTAPYKILLGDFRGEDEWPGEPDLQFHVRELVENIRLGLLLADPDSKHVLGLSWQKVLDPLQPGMGLSWRNPQESPRYTPAQLTEPQAAEWGKWAQRVGDLRTPTVAVAIRRMLAAVAERNTTEDVLVDAVIVWENLVGAKTETVLRVCSSLAWLLCSDKEDRLTQQRAFKKIYELRSKLVHGDASPDRKKVAESSRDAVKVSLQALRAVFSEHSWLLQLPTSEERSLQLIHGATLVRGTVEVGESEQ